MVRYGRSAPRRRTVPVVVFPALPAHAETEVDLALVVAVDISFSMDTEEQALQRGFAQAFRSQLVHDAIRGGMLGKIAVTYMEWAGSADQKVIIPWTVLDISESLMAFADKIASNTPCGGPSGPPSPAPSISA